MKISASWELGFSDFNIVLLKEDDKNIENGEIIAEEEKVCEECKKSIDGEDKCGEGCPAYDAGWKETH